jgi:protein gp37
MGRTSIEWADYTFNPWWGCEKVSPACTNCYAETFANRIGQKVWGKNAPRRTMSPKYWIEPHRWDVQAKHADERCRVFCASMADVFELRPGLQPLREQLWTLIESTTGLDWLLLTKRPENILQMIPDSWKRRPRANVWYGTTVESQEWAEKRIPALLEVPARVRFLSCEPLLGPVDLEPFLRQARVLVDDKPFVDERGVGYPARCIEPPPLIHWVIAGGESGGHPRPMHPKWVRALRDQTKASGVPFFFKQWGELLPGGNNVLGPTWPHGKPARIPPASAQLEDEFFYPVGKKEAGRLLDGRTWGDLPTPGEGGA